MLGENYGMSEKPSVYCTQMQRVFKRQTICVFTVLQECVGFLKSMLDVTLSLAGVLVLESGFCLNWMYSTQSKICVACTGKRVDWRVKVAKKLSYRLKASSQARNLALCFFIQMSYTFTERLKLSRCSEIIWRPKILHSFGFINK